MVTIDSIMHKPVVTATPEEAIAQAAGRMREAGVGAVVVVENERVTGIFTERDLVSVVAQGLDPAATPVGEAATRDVVTIDSGSSWRACAEALRDRGIRHVPIVNDGRPVGVLSARDFFSAAAEGFERYIERARFDDQLRNNVDPYDHMGGSYGR